MKTKIAALRQERGEQITVMEANVAGSNQQETNAYSAARAETERLGARITDMEAMMQVAEVLRVGEEFAARNCDKPLAEFRTLALDEQARRSNGVGEILGYHGTTITRDRHDHLVEHMSEALTCRFNGRAPSEGAREFQGARLTDLARELCRQNGLRPPMHASGIVEMAMATTSDFPNLLQSTGNRVMLGGYEASIPALRQVARISTVPDFRAKTTIRLTEMPSLEKVLEHGEITYGARGEAVENYAAFTYARLFSLSRQAIINDDLGAFRDYFRSFGVAAAQLEARLLVGLLTANSGYGATMADTHPLFDVANHHNAIASGAPPNIAELGEARTLLRLQTDLDGVTVLGITPKFLVVSAKHETAGEQVLASLAAPSTADANPFTGKLTLVTVPQLDATYPKRWYLFGSPDAAQVLELSYLDGAPGPRIETKEGWTSLGVEYRCYEDIGVGVVSHRGAVLDMGE